LQIDGAVRAADPRRGVGAQVKGSPAAHRLQHPYLLHLGDRGGLFKPARYDGARYGYRAEGARDLGEMYRRSRSEGFGREVKRRIMLGTYVLSSGYYDAYYLKAQKVRTLLKTDFDAAFKKVDLIVTPTTPSTAFRFGEKTEDPLQMYLSDIFTATINLVGIPALSLPCGIARDGLPPIGAQNRRSRFPRRAFWVWPRRWSPEMDFRSHLPAESPGRLKALMPVAYSSPSWRS
jgi:Asp-tRNA(Asn)/Glu-tRNA(Gln) amidotransferase A subunit family amidase